MRTLVVDYCYSSGFKIPSKIPLLSVEENKKAKWQTPWSWYVKYDRLHYFDKKGERNVIEPDYSATDGPDFKYPVSDSEVFDSDGESECESESDEEDDGFEERVKKWESEWAGEPKIKVSEVDYGIISKKKEKGDGAWQEEINNKWVFLTNSGECFNYDEDEPDKPGEWLGLFNFETQTLDREVPEPEWE